MTPNKTYIREFSDGNRCVLNFFGYNSDMLTCKADWKTPPDWGKISKEYEGWRTEVAAMVHKEFRR